MNWEELQKRSNEILSAGIWELKSSTPDLSDYLYSDKQGVYLISLNKKPYYIGEAKSVGKRLQQQFKESTSTFYKNYRKGYESRTPIKEFGTQSIQVKIGRKEMEEFGIVNLSCSLNRFQLGKKPSVPIKQNKKLWHSIQNDHLSLLKQGEKIALANKFQPWNNAIIRSTAGLYILKDSKNEIIYIGESSDISARHKTHSKQTYFSSLRRNVARTILGLELKVQNGKRKYLDPIEEIEVNSFLSDCKISGMDVDFGRYELEEYLIDKHQPLLNRKGSSKKEVTQMRSLNLSKPKFKPQSLNDKPKVISSSKSIHKYEDIWILMIPHLKEFLNSSELYVSFRMLPGDFNQVGNRKSYSFNLELNNGKVTNNINGSAVARDFARILTSQPNLKSLLQGNYIKINMDKKFILHVRKM